LFVLAAAIGVVGTQKVAAVNPQPLPPQAQYFPLVGLTAGQVARVSLSNVVAPPGATCEQLTPQEVTIVFSNRDGSPLKDPTTGAPFQPTVTLAPCTSAFVDLDSDLFLNPAPAQGERLEVGVVCITKRPELPGGSADQTDGPAARAAISPPTTSIQLRPPVIAGMEVFDKATGRTTLNVNAIIGILVG
jgi:hypothetical protein